jgi:hypothetical protein
MALTLTGHDNSKGRRPEITPRLNILTRSITPLRCVTGGSLLAPLGWRDVAEIVAIRKALTHAAYDKEKLSRVSRRRASSLPFLGTEDNLLCREQLSIDLAFGRTQPSPGTSRKKAL